MRIKGIIFVLVLAGLGFAASFFITDEFIENKIEYQASLINEAKVEIDGFEFDLFSLKVGWERLQVTNPKNTMVNTFETGVTEFNVDFWPLLWNKVIIENVTMTGFELETERETDGYFEMPVDEEGEEDPGIFAEVTKQVGGEISKNANMKFTAVKDDINVDSLMAMVDLRSIDKMDSLKNGLNDNYSKWDSTINNNTILRDVNQMRNTLQALNVNEMKDPKKAIDALKDIQGMVKKADSLKKSVVDLKENFVSDLNTSKNSLESIPNWIREDIDRASGIAKLPEINAQSIGTALFGANLLGDFNTYMGYLGTAREYGSRLKGPEEEEEEVERFKGKNYEFSDKYDLPVFWVKEIELSGVTKNDIDLRGLVTDVSSDQNKTGKPLLIEMGGEDANKTGLRINAEINYLEEKPRESVKVAYAGFPLRNSRISPSELIPYELNSGTGELSFGLNVIGKRFDSEIKYLASDVSFDFNSAGRPKNQIESLIRTAISSADDINATALVDNTSGPLRVRVRSNIDDMFLNTLKNTISREVENAKRRIRNEVESRVNAKKREVEQLVRQKEAQLRAEYDKFERKVTDQLHIVEEKKKELEKKKKELEDSLKNKAVDTIRDKIGF